MTAVMAPAYPECREAVEGDGWEPCERPAVTVRLDEEGHLYPVCARHRGGAVDCTCPQPGRRRDRIVVGTCPHCVVVRARLLDRPGLADVAGPATAFHRAVTENA